MPAKSPAIHPFVSLDSMRISPDRPPPPERPAMSKTSRPPRHSPYGFTLIELLVVISIIALLIAVLLPALAAARESAQSMACLSNEKQIGISVVVYQDDYKTFYPGYRRVEQDGVTNTNEWWAARLTWFNYVSDTKVYRCPSDRELRVDFVDMANLPAITDSDWRRVHYAVNTDHVWTNRLYTHYPERGNSASWQKPVRQIDITDPTKTINFTDSHSGPGTTVAVGAYDYMQSTYDAATTAGVPWARHSSLQSINVAWCDGHATAVRITNINDPWSTGLTSFDLDRAGNWWDVYPH
jgi:prepilin-type N-terminal cleavage/methylation domain-containing protein/prepilin-type processing-associated H-X9-DG protein